MLVHPGGPFWKKRDEGAWSIPKGEIEPRETAIHVARREFEEELGAAPPDGPWLDLGRVRQAGGKVVQAWATEGDYDPAALRSDTFEIEWPPRSGRRATFPEVDRAAWYEVDAARRMILDAQRPFIDRLEELLPAS